MITTCPATQATRSDVVRLARQIAERHAPFAVYARGPEYFDCIGLVVYIGVKLELLPADIHIPEYCFPPSAKPFRAFDEHCTEKPLSELAEGDIVILGKMRTYFLPQHCLIATKLKERWHLIGVLMGSSQMYTTEFLFTPDLWEQVWKVYAFKGL